MERVHSVDEKPFEDIVNVGVAIGVSYADQRHIGMLHRDSDSDTVLMLHLAWHHRLRNEPPEPSFLWADPAIHPKRLVQVAAICRKVWRANKNGGIPYAFSHPNDCFDADTGRYLLGPTRLGLTCATFILAVFHTAGLQLVQYESWPIGREGDAEWRQRMVSLLEQHGACPDHVKAVRNDVGSARYRPEEVAGAATVSPLPADFEMAAGRGRQILERLENN